MESIANLCHDLNPSMSGRPDRNSDWIRSISKDIRANLTKINMKYRQSGNQDSENKYDEWVKFASGNSLPTVYSYAICLFDASTLDNLGKAIPSDIQKDTGSTSTIASPAVSRTYSDSVGATNRRRQRQRLNDMISSGKSKTYDFTPPIERVIADHLKHQNHNSTAQSQQLMQWRALEFLASRDDPDALCQIRIMAGLHNSNSSTNNFNCNLVSPILLLLNMAGYVVIHFPT